MTITPAGVIETVEEIREVVEPELRDLEAEWDLRGFPIRFEFASSHVRTDSETDRSQHSAIAVFEAIATTTASVALEAKIHLQPPSGEYRSTPVVDFLRYRWLSSTKPYDELPSSASYALLTYLESLYGTRKQVAAKLNLDFKVLETLGRLSAQSDPHHGRKFKGQSRPFTAEERTWLTEFINVVGRRAATVESGNNPSDKITMTDLPKLEP